MMYNITLLQIEAFLTVGEYLNFTEAAKALYISQPSLSQKISRIEEYFGKKLFIRGKHGVELTKEGKYLYSELRGYYENICRVFNNVRNMDDKPVQIVRIGCHTSHISADPNSYFECCIMNFKQAYPDVTVIEELFEFSELRKVLLLGDVDLIYTGSFILENMQNISWREVSKHDYYIAMSEHHPLASCDRLQIDALNNEVFYSVAPDDNKSIVNGSFARFRQFGFTPKKVIPLPNFPSVLMAVKKGEGMMLCGSTINTESSLGIKFFQAPSVPDPPSMIVAWRTNDVSETARSFISMIAST